MIDVGKPLGKCPEIARKLHPIHLRSRDVSLKPRQYLAVEASTIPPRAFLELRVQLNRDVLERQCGHGVFAWNRNGTT